MNQNIHQSIQDVLDGKQRWALACGDARVSSLNHRAGAGTINFMKTTNNTCEICGQLAGLNVNGDPKRFCSPACNKEWRRRRWQGNTLRTGKKPANAFETGFVPWNKGARGIHLSPNTEFTKGQRSSRQEPLGVIRTRMSKRDGKYRAWIKVAQPNVWRPRAVVVWELAYGPVAPDKLVHHKNRDTLNDALENLEVMTRAEHLKEHRQEFRSVRKLTCKRGHDLSVTRYVAPSGATYCCLCQKERRKEKRSC